MSESTSANARRTAARLQDSPVMHGLARVGFVTNGLLHVLIGGLAVAVALGGAGDAGHSGALAQLAAAPGGVFLLWAVVVGMWGLALFKLLETALVRGTDKEAWGQRAKELGTAIIYLFIGGTALTYARGGASSGSEGETLSAQILAAPGGVFLLMVVSLVIIGVGVYFVVKGYRRTFLRDIRSPGGSTGKATRVLGTVGYIAKGIAIAVVGILFGVAAATSDPSEATGLDGALKTLAGLPFGVLILIAVAIGLMAYGVYCLARARYDRL